MSHLDIRQKITLIQYFTLLKSYKPWGNANKTINYLFCTNKKVD